MSADPTKVQARDLVVIGCSAGGIEALPHILEQLPSDLPATIFVCQHLAATENTYLVEILRRGSKLPVEWVEQGVRIERGRVYVAPPDVHTIFADGHVRLARTARENHARPSIDKLFRSAAAQHGSRVIGVLLTGMLDDGVAGMRAIAAAGGATIVQDPEEAAYPELPANALRSVDVDRKLPLDAIAHALVSMTRERVSILPIPEAIVIEAEVDLRGAVEPTVLESMGPQVSIACPECQGPMWEIGDEKGRRFRCYLGHAASAASLLEQNNILVEAALWSAIRALGDRATTLETLARDAAKLGSEQITDTYAARARETRRQADLAREFMLALSRPTPP